MIVQGQIERDAGGPVNRICQDLPGEWTPGMLRAEDIDALLDPDNRVLPEEACDFIPWTSVLL